MQTATLELNQVGAVRARPWRVRAWAYWMVMRRAVVLDTETAALDGGVCEIAVVDLQGAVLFHTLVNPGRPIEPAAERVHGLSDADLEQAPALTQVVRDLGRAVRGRPVLAYNAPFDFSVLSRDAQHQGVDLGRLGRWRRWGCVMRARSAASGSPWQPLGAAHRATGDALAAAELVRQLARL